MDDHETGTNDLVERLEDSKGWPNLGKAAAARIRELEAEKKELTLDVLAAQGQAADLEAENARLREVLGEAEARILADAKVIEAAKKLADLMSIGECPWREGTREHRDFWQDRQEALADYTAALEEKNDE